MHLTLRFDTENINWEAVANIYKEAGLGEESPEALQARFDAADAVCFAFDIDLPIGQARAVKTDAGGDMLDLAILPSYTGFSLGHTIHDYLSRRFDGELVITAESDEAKELYTKMELTEFMS